MRSYILSKHEQQLIEQYLESNQKTETLRMLKLRMKKAYPRLTNDLKLIDKALKKFSAEIPQD
jgi:23S rRNA C2498 (ribose-2'-O)-methylase RlmM